MIASKPYVFPPRIVFTLGKQYSEEVQRMIIPEREPCVINYFHS